MLILLLESGIKLFNTAAVGNFIENSTSMVELLLAAAFCWPASRTDPPEFTSFVLIGDDIVCVVGSAKKSVLKLRVEFSPTSLYINI